MKVRYLHEMLGTNYRMTDIAAAIGIVQLGKLDQFTAARCGHGAPGEEGCVRARDDGGHVGERRDRRTTELAAVDG
jgi:hypothetical protein